MDCQTLIDGLDLLQCKRGSYWQNIVNISKNGIFQGGSLSVKLYVLSIIPLSLAFRKIKEVCTKKYVAS